MIESTGISIRSGWKAGSVPCARFSQGRIRMAKKVTSISAPPALWTHLPTPRPTVVSSTRPPISAMLTRPMNHLLPVSPSLDGPRM